MSTLGEMRGSRAEVVKSMVRGLLLVLMAADAVRAEEEVEEDAKACCCCFCNASAAAACAACASLTAFGTLPFFFGSPTTAVDDAEEPISCARSSSKAFFGAAVAAAPSGREAEDVRLAFFAAGGRWEEVVVEEVEAERDGVPGIEPRSGVGGIEGGGRAVVAAEEAGAVEEEGNGDRVPGGGAKGS